MRRMADYWKSNPRKFCDACKCWFGDNKVSVEFHEGGRRHQANVQKKLEQARKRSAENEKEKQNIAKTLSAIEHAALIAYQQDISGGKVKKAKMPAVLSPEIEREQQLQQLLAMDQEELEREMEKKEIEEKAQQKILEIQGKALESAYKAYSTSYVHSVSWQQCYTLEGYPYYYNSATGVTQWEVPAEFQVAVLPPMLQVPPPPGAATAPNKRPLDKAEVEEQSACQPSKRRNPYGEWSTVSVIERDEEAEGEEGEENQRGDTEDTEEGKEDRTSGEIQFEEKQISGGLSAETKELKGDFKGFAFKKRTSKERPQIRQRTSDF